MTGRSGKFSSAPRAGLRIAMLAAFMLLTRSSRSRHARDTYTRRMEGVSLWVVPSAEIVASDPDAGRASVRAGGEQDLPPPDLLRHPGRGEAHLMASLPPIGRDCRRRGASAATRRVRRARGRRATPRSADARTDYLLRLGDDALILGQRLGEWCGHAPALEVDLSLANLALDLIGQATHSARAKRATATSSPSIATCSISRTACWSSSPMATSRRRSRGTCSSRPGSICCCSG